MSQTIHVMLVEDNPDYREVIRLTLEDEPDIALASEFSTAEVALRSLRNSDPRGNLDIILLDLNLPGMNGLDALPLFKSSRPDAGIIILTQSDSEQDVLKAIMLGASGYLLKSSTVSQITDGIRTVNRGGASLDPGVAKFILNTLQTKLPKGEMEQLLTEREMEVLTLLAEGCVKKTIADRLEISISTVVTHVAHIYEKLKVQNAPSAIATAFRLGILPIDKTGG